ncbi:hypothetical protein Tco_0367068 [Tanacetum coccineum]
MLYYIARSERYNLAYFIAKGMEFVTKQPRFTKQPLLILPYERKTRKDYGTRRGHSSTSSSSAFGQPSSSHPNDDDNDGNDKGTLRASTPSPTRFVNSLSNNIPQIFSNPPNVDPNMEVFYTRQTEILNRQVQLRDEQRGGIRSIEKGIKNLWRKKKNENDDTTTPSPITKSSSLSLPNAPSKTPSTKYTSSTFGTTSSLFESKPRSSPLSSNDTCSPQPSNPFLDDIMDAPLRPSIHFHFKFILFITLSLSPITPLDYILDTPSPPSPQLPLQPPLMGHPIYFNMFDYHGVNYLCFFLMCGHRRTSTREVLQLPRQCT